MGRVALVAVLLTALAVPAVASAAAGPPPGKYSTKIAAPPPLKGTWTLTFARNGTYTIAQAGRVVVRGHDFSVGSQIKFSKETGPKACTADGYYNFKRTGKTLTFHSLSDKGCAGRALVLGHRFTFAG